MQTNTPTPSPTPIPTPMATPSPTPTPTPATLPSPKPHPTSLDLTPLHPTLLHATPLHSTPSTPNSALVSWGTRKATCGFTVEDSDTDFKGGDRVPKSLQTWKWQDLVLLRAPWQGVISRQHGLFRGSPAFSEFWTRALTYAWCVRKGCCPWG